MKAPFFSLVALGSSDLEALARTELRCFPSPWSRKALETELSRETNIGARGTEGMLLGYVFYLKVADEIQILNIAVDPEHRNKGVATAMLKELLRRARAQGIRVIALDVRPSNAEALSLYGKFGFRKVGSRCRYYSDGEESWIMTLSLGPADPLG